MRNSKKNGALNAISDRTTLLNASFSDDLDTDMELEVKTREKIDKRLNKAGWSTDDVSLVKQEIDTKNSDFKKKIYKTKSETRHLKQEKAYADYVLLDSRGFPLAVIEAKRTSKDPRTGQKQAEDYAKDIDDQIDSSVLIYYTNGAEIWFWNKGYSNPRKVLGFHSQDDLERQLYQNKNKKNLSEIPIRDEIINRSYQIEAVERVSEGIDKLAKRKFLLTMATGTGKTRVSMEIIDRMLKSKRAQRILFLVDRDELRTQAFDDNIVKFFPSESKQKIFSKSFNTDARIYVSTLQTMINIYKEFSIGFFDLIISDEAHRSIFNVFENILTYFDSVQIGLTATPSKMLGRNTFESFDCEDKIPTFQYTYEEAEPRYLAPYKVFPSQTHFQIEGIQSKDIPKEERIRLRDEEGIDEDDLNFTDSEIEKKVSVTGINNAWIQEFWENCLRDDAGLPCKTIIFPTSIKHGRMILELFENEYPQHKGEMMRLISSDDSKSKTLVKEFKENSLPRIAISVGILDTGVDIPEVCNLVFARPTKSKIRFWQMIGRGTRHDSTCENKDWLPIGGKMYFKIFDFMTNFERLVEGNPPEDTSSASPSIINRIINVKLDQYKFVKKGGN